MGVSDNLLDTPICFRSCITRAILKLAEDRETAVYLGVNEDLEGKPDAERALLDNFFIY